MAILVRFIGLGLAVGVILTGIAIFFLFDLNYFETYETDHQATCQPVVGLVGVEDMAVHDNRGEVWMSSMDRRAKADEEAADERGRILLFDPANPLDAASWRDRTGGVPANLQPLGISVVQSGTTRRLFVINETDPSVLIYEIGPDDRLTLLKTLTDYRLTSPNNIVATGPDSFYVTNDVPAGRHSLQARLDFLTKAPSGLILYFDGQSWSNAADGLRFPNGLALSEDGRRLYVAELSARNLKVFDRAPSTGVILPADDIPLSLFPDNLTLHQDRLLVSGHPSPVTFSRYARKPDVASPSQVIAMRADSVGVSGMETLFTDDGTSLSGSSVAVEVGTNRLIGSYADNKILLCTPG